MTASPDSLVVTITTTAVETIEKHEILKALSASRGNKSRAARKLGISRFTLQRKIEKYEITTGSP